MSSINENSKILVLGTGLIGSAFQRLFTGKNYKEVIAVNSHNVDLCDTNETINFFKKVKPDYVINAAGKVGGIIANRDHPADFIVENLSIQMNVIKAAHQVGIERLIFFASSCMYPKEASQPMKEDALLTGKPEETSMPYAISKIAGMQLCLAFNQQFGINKYIPVIPNSVYGPNDNFDPNSGHVLSSLIRRFHDAKENKIKELVLWGTGSPRREFIHSDDLARACFILLSEDYLEVDFPINVGVSEDISIKDLAKIIAEIVGYEGKILWDKTKPDGAPRKLLESSRISSLGWTPLVTLKKGIHETYNWYKEKILKKDIE
ncbi:MAG: GDP-L-fucose synthase [Ignavibacteriaceae bacterium]|jgi:GDP-L-fucose synthase